jgi:hemoglobin-like flavoprotein
MTSTQHQVLLDCWHELGASSDRAAQLFFDHLRTLDAECWQLFAGDGHADPSVTFQRMVSEIIALHEDPRDLVVRAAELGRRHAAFGVRDTDYRSVHDALLWALEQTTPTLARADVRVAWNEAFALLSSIMRRAGSGAHARR